MQNIIHQYINLKINTFSKMPVKKGAKKRSAKKKGTAKKRSPSTRVVYVNPQTGEGIGDWIRSARKGLQKANRAAKNARIVGRTDDFLAKTGLRDPVRNLITQNVPFGAHVVSAADFAKQRGYGRQQGDGILGDLLTGASSLIPGVGPAVAPLVGNLTKQIGLGNQRGGRRKAIEI